MTARLIDSPPDRPLRPARDQRHAELIARARELASQFAALAPTHDRSGDAPRAQFQALHEAGLLRLNIATRDGGHGAGLSVARAVVSAIARGDPSVALILAMHYCQHAAIVHAERTHSHEWPDELARRLTRESVEGIALINAAQVEPELGSPSHGGLPATIARRDGDYWRITGHKRYVTGIPLLSWVNVLALTDEAEPCLGNFLVPTNAPGVRVIENWDPIGMRATASHDVVFDNAPVALSHVVALKPARLGLQRDAHATAWYFSLAGSVYDGVAQAAFGWLIDFLKTRQPTALGGSSLASVPTIQDAVGRIALLLESNQWLLNSHATAFDDDTAPAALGGTVKYFVIEQAVAAVEQAIQLAGNHGLARRNPLERHHRDVLCGRIHAPPNALLRANYGKAALA